MSIFAKLLSTENVNVVRKVASTASFNVETRTLTLPIFKKPIPESVDDMFIAHEASHALHTGETVMSFVHKFPNLHKLVNIVEDIRIERIMCRKYRGLIKAMRSGYQTAIDGKLFFHDVKVEKLNFLDRLNVHYKAGFHYNVPFNVEERLFVDEAYALETEEEVVEFCKRLAAYIKANKKTEKKEAPKPSKSEKTETGSGESTSGEVEEPSDDSDEESTSGEVEETETETDEESTSEAGEPSDEESTSDEEETSGGSGELTLSDDELSELEIDSETSGAEHEFIENNASDNNYIHTVSYDDPVFTPANFIPNKKTVNYINRYRRSSLDDNSMANCKKAALHMFKEYEQKKAASVHKRTKSAKTGMLDVNKLYRHQFDNELFRSVEISNDGDNHGIVVLVDWSASVNALEERAMVEQLIATFMFCKMADIAFEAITFTQGFFHAFGALGLRDTPTGGYTYYFNILSSKMSDADFKSVAIALLSRSTHIPKGGTPLAEFMITHHKTVVNILKSMGVSKPILIVMTDGASHSLKPVGDRFSFDITTKKGNVINSNSAIEIEAEGLKMIRSQVPNLKAVNIFFQPSKNRIGYKEVNGFTRNKFTDYATLTAITEKYKNDGFYRGNHTCYDVDYMVRFSANTFDSVELEESDDEKKIARSFIKGMKNSVGNRTFISALMKEIS